MAWVRCMICRLSPQRGIFSFSTQARDAGLWTPLSLFLSLLWDVPRANSLLTCRRLCMHLPSSLHLVFSFSFFGWCRNVAGYRFALFSFRVDRYCGRCPANPDSEHGMLGH